MFFAAFIGDPSQEPAWRDALRAHAAWLGISDYPSAWLSQVPEGCR